MSEELSLNMTNFRKALPAMVRRGSRDHEGTNTQHQYGGYGPQDKGGKTRPRSEFKPQLPIAEKNTLFRPNIMTSHQYGVVPTAADGDDDEPPCSCFQRYLLGGTLTPSQKSALAGRQPDDGNPQQLTIRLHPESVRQIAYAAFWSMCVLAIVLSKTMVPPIVIEESDLKKVFGYNNVSDE